MVPMVWIWSAWLLALIVTFAVLEGYALARGKLTLSRYTYDISASWPLSIFLLGLLAGGLAVHFWWHFCPPGSVTGG